MHEDGQDVAFVTLGEDREGAVIGDQLVLTVPDLDGEVACRTGFGFVAFLIEIAGIIGKRRQRHQGREQEHDPHQKVTSQVRKSIAALGATTPFGVVS